MKTKMIKSLLAIVCLLSSINVSAYDFEVDGIYYDVVSISEFTCKVVKKYNGYKYSGDVVIPAHVNYANKTLTVVKIADKVFYDCSELTGITIPNTITSIGDCMFYGCEKLERVKIEDGDNVLNLYGSAFLRCPLMSLYVGRNLSFSTSSGGSPFYGKKLKDLTISNCVTEIGSYAFECCSGLTSITIPNSVTKIGSYAFKDCSGLTSISIPNSVTEISSYAFQNCSGLTSVTIGNSVTEIGSGAFQNCSGLTSVTIPNSVTEIGSYAFRYCSGLTSVTIPNSVTSIGVGAFSYCSGLTSISIPNSVTSIGNYAFCDCSGLTSVTIGNSVTEIGSCAFCDCSGLTSLVVPESVTYIGYSNIVRDCTALTALYILNTTPPTINSKYFITKEYMTLNVFVPQEALAAYQSAEVWKDLWNLQGFDATGIDNVKNDIINGDAKCYDLRGNRLSAPKRGLNIINGKKVIVK